ncbi:hypothetical protein McanCB56680_007982 [Microsporum canis]
MDSQKCTGDSVGGFSFSGHDKGLLPPPEAECQLVQRKTPHPGLRLPLALKRSFRTVSFTSVSDCRSPRSFDKPIYTFEELVDIHTPCVRYGYYWKVFMTLLETDEVLLINPSHSFDAHSLGAGVSSVMFESAQLVWLCPGVGLKRLCQRLSGTTRMILDLAGTDSPSEERESSQPR